ncbi:MAG: hypothetical protein KDD22_00600 [Bdellovibrionales bacterium]|nr:hypothetical protein [Bdellovibrionales bacterium]
MNLIVLSIVMGFVVLGGFDVQARNSQNSLFSNSFASAESIHFDLANPESMNRVVDWSQHMGEPGVVIEYYSSLTVSDVSYAMAKEVGQVPQNVSLAGDSLFQPGFLGTPVLKAIERLYEKAYNERLEYGLVAISQKGQWRVSPIVTDHAPRSISYPLFLESLTKLLQVTNKKDSLTVLVLHTHPENFPLTSADKRVARSLHRLLEETGYRKAQVIFSAHMSEKPPEEINSAFVFRLKE